MDSAKNKHLTLEERRRISECLKNRMTFKGIAKLIGKDPTTVSKEIKKHIEVRAAVLRRRTDNGHPIQTTTCPTLSRVPFVCNGCGKLHGSCGFERHVYVAGKAHAQYREDLSQSRSGIPLNKEQFYRNDEILSAAIKSGQHLYHAIQTNNLHVSKSTVYRHLKQGYLSIGALDMPRVPKFRPRRKHSQQSIPKGLKIGRTHDDFISYTRDFNIEHWVEMDTVIGRIGGKTLLTLHFTACGFMIAILLDDKSCAQAAAAIKRMKAHLKEQGFSFGNVFPLILTDNGGEFSDVFAIENNAEDARETRLFFCDPYQSCQKPHVENNHTMLRSIIPSGSSFDGFTQDTVNMICSHVNSVKRKVLNGKTAFETFSFLYGAKLANLLGIREIPAQRVCQSPALLKR